MELTVWITAALAAARWATLITRDTFGPIRHLVDRVKYRWPDSDDLYYESEVSGNEDIGWTVNNLSVVPAGSDEYGYAMWRPLDPHPVGTLLSCVRCMSVWTGLAAAALVLLAPAWIVWPVLLPFAFSQIAITLTSLE